MKTRLSNGYVRNNAKLFIVMVLFIVMIFLRQASAQRIVLPLGYVTDSTMILLAEDRAHHQSAVFTTGQTIKYKTSPFDSYSKGLIIGISDTTITLYGPRAGKKTLAINSLKVLKSIGNQAAYGRNLAGTLAILYGAYTAVVGIISIGYGNLPVYTLIFIGGGIATMIAGGMAVAPDGTEVNLTKSWTLKTVRLTDKHNVVPNGDKN